jgi:hypothetical protein
MATALFENDLIALIVVSLIGAGLLLMNRIIKYVINKIKSIRPNDKNKINFIIRIVFIVIFLYVFINGFPLFANIDPQYLAIITGAITTAVAFASSEIFSNFVAGILLMIVNPFDVGDIVKVQGYKGIIRSINLTKVTLETFDSIIIELFNNDVVSTIIMNYTHELKHIRSYDDFKNIIKAPQDKGNAKLDVDIITDHQQDNEDREFHDLYDSIRESNVHKIHSYTFTMRIPYKGFRIKVAMFENACQEYRNKFGFKPRFHIMDYNADIFVKFRIITFDDVKLFRHQPEFAKRIYEIGLSEHYP